jgi:hypothetical protein
VFEDTVQAPWCYLEFGNVKWCEDPALLDPRLRSAATHAASSRPQTQLVGEASTNGELFLAFPANGPVRNSFTQTGSLLHLLCRGSSAQSCAGPTAKEAAFRAGNGTFPRMIGAIAIAVGAFGAAAILGFLALRLLTASLVGLLLLLVAPAAVLAPALGDGGRSAFTNWATRLIGAALSRLLCSVLLGALLLTEQTLMSLQLGWWTQWLLLSAFWWGTFIKRHELLSLFYTRGSSTQVGASHPYRRLEALGVTSFAVASARWFDRRARAPSQAVERTPTSAEPSRTLSLRPPMAGGPPRRGGPPRPEGPLQPGEPPRPGGSGRPGGPSKPGGPPPGKHTSPIESPARAQGRPAQSAATEDGSTLRVWEDIRAFESGEKAYLGFVPPEP